MKIAIFGNTLYAGVMSALLSESGHFVYWCSHISPNENGQQYSFHDENVSRLLETQ
jgi:UDPglucose 6-dehydrogenase